MQQALLKLVEGTIASVPPKGGRKHPQQELLHVDTSNILFICGGALTVWIISLCIVRVKSAMGFAADIDSKLDRRALSELLAKIEPIDLVKFGLIPEFVGRLPLIAPLSELDQASLVRVLTEPKMHWLSSMLSFFKWSVLRLNFPMVPLRLLLKKHGKKNRRSRFTLHYGKFTTR